MRKKTWIFWAIILIATVLYISGCGTQKINLLKNPSFEKTFNGKPTCWETMAFNPNASEFKVEQGMGRSGHQCVTIINHEQNDARFCQVVPVTEFKCYKVSAWVKTENIGKQQIGANISVKEDMATSYDIRGTHNQWEYLELYLQIGKGIQSVSLTCGLGGYGSINTGKVTLDDIRMEEADTLPTGIVLNIGEVENCRQPKNPSLKLIVFNYGFMILLAIIVILMFILIYHDLTRKQGLYFSGKKYLLLAVFLLIFFTIYMVISPQLSTQIIQQSFMILLILVVAWALFLRKTGKLRGDTFIFVLIILGIGLRICYFLYTGYGVRQHDVNGEGGHFEYIKYIAEHCSLPPSGSYQLYHPPIHHIISAAFFALGKLFGLDESMSWRLIQIVMVFFSSLSLIFFYKILKLINCGNTAKTIGVAAFAFHPANIYLSAFLNNDNTLLFFYVMSFYFLIRWLKEHSLRNGLWLAIFTSLGILTKKTAFILLPIIFIAVLVTWYKDRSNYKIYWKQAGYFLLIVIPSAIIYPLRNYSLFHQGINYTPSVPFDLLAGNSRALFGVSLNNLLQNPFTFFPPLNAGISPESFLEYLFKSSLFGEWDFAGLKMTATLLVIFAGLNLINFILLLGYSWFTKRSKNTGKYFYIFGLNVIFLSIMVVKARFDYPFFCTQNFRYLTPILISIFVLWGQAAQHVADQKKTFWEYISVSLTVAFCAVSAAFILMIGIS